MRIYWTLLFFGLVTGFPSTIHAAEHLKFESNWQTRPARHALRAFLTNYYDSLETIHLAEIDLNGDGLPEYITAPAPASCASPAGCAYTVSALNDERPVLLGQFTGHKVILSDKRDYGVRQILVYTNAQNDYDYVEYKWDPQEQMFKPDTSPKESP